MDVILDGEDTNTVDGENQTPQEPSTEEYQDKDAEDSDETQLA